MANLRNRWLAGVLATMLLGVVGGAGGTRARADDGAGAKDGANADTGDGAVDAQREEAKYEKTIEFLLSEYGRIGQSHDWLIRSLTALSIARLPQSTANRSLLLLLKDDSSPAVQLVAWESLLARAKTVDPEQYDKWASLTPPLVYKNVFNGRLRVDLLRFLAIAPPDAASKKIFAKLFDETSSLESNDMPVLDELGRTLATWHSGDLAKALIAGMKNLNDAYRAEYVLHAAGCTAAWAGNRSDLGSKAMWDAAIKDYVAWWKANKDSWKEMTARADGTPWRDLKSSLLTVTIFDREAVRVNNPEVRNDLELGNPTLKSMDVAFVVDATESMTPPLTWLRDDMRKTMTVLAMLSSHPRIGVTFYRDYGSWPSRKDRKKYEFIAKTYPLTTNVDALVSAVAGMKAFGGGDDPEAVQEGLENCFKRQGWDLSHHEGEVDYTPDPKAAAAQTRAATAPAEPTVQAKVVILIGDAPPHPGTEKACIDMAKQALENGFKVYAVKLTTPLGEDKGNLPSFDDIAKAGGGVSFAVNFAGNNFAFLGTPPAKSDNTRFVWTAKAPIHAAPSQQVLTRVLLDAVNPKYRERIEMVVPLLLEICERPVPEVRESFKAAEAAKAEPAKKTGPQKPAPPAKHQQF